MAKKKQKYYVVWEGKVPGIYLTWEDCSAQVTGVAGSKYKSFNTIQEAEQAFRSSAEESIKSANEGVSVVKKDAAGKEYLFLPPEVISRAIAVDAACSGNPGIMEYRGVALDSADEVFHSDKINNATNNIGEFLAIVHALRKLKAEEANYVIYSDSETAMLWVRQRSCKSKLPKSSDTAHVWKLIAEAESWLHTHTYSTLIYKWKTEIWGEIPADFGRK